MKKKFDFHLSYEERKKALDARTDLTALVKSTMPTGAVDLILSFKIEEDENEDTIGLFVKATPRALTKLKAGEEEDLDDLAVEVIIQWAKNIAESRPDLAEGIEMTLDDDWYSGMGLTLGETYGTYEGYSFFIYIDKE